MNYLLNTIANIVVLSSISLSSHAISLLPKKTPELLIEGVDTETEQNIRAFSTIEQKSCDVSTIDRASVTTVTQTNAQNALKALGFYKASIQTNINETEDCWSLTLVINQGPPIIVSQLVFAIDGVGKQDERLSSTLASIKLKEGERFRSDYYETAKSTLMSRAARRGYLDAKWQTSQVGINTDNNTADVNLVLDSGARYVLGDIIYNKKPLVVDEKEYPLALSQTLIERLVDLRSSDTFLVSDLINAQRRLNSTGYFSNASLALDTEQASNGQVPLIVTLVPALTHHYKFGVGYSTDLGPRVRFDYDNKRINTAGHQFSINSSLSAVESTVGARYRWPSIAQPLDRSYSVTFGLQDKNSDTVESTSAKLGISLTQKLASGWEYSLFTDARLEDFTAGEDSERVFLLTPGASVSKTQADNLTYTTRGYRIQGTLLGASDALASDISLVQASIKAKGILSINDRTRWISRGQLGSTWTNDFERLPASLRFFAGGDSSIRGYDYESIGPRDRNNDNLGGQHLVVASTEVDYKFTDAWGAAVFLDSGDAFTDTLSPKYSVGTGVRWFSPVGPVRIDLAFPVDDEDADLVKLHLQLGPDL